MNVEHSIMRGLNEAPSENARGRTHANTNESTQQHKRGDTVFGQRKSEKVWKHEKVANTQLREWDVYFTDSHLIWCHYARATLIFKKKGEGRAERQRLAYATKPPWGICIFWRSRAMQRSGRVYMTMTPQRRLPYSITVQDQRLGSSPSLTRFSQFSARLWWETYESMLCAFRKLGAWLNPPHRWPCVEWRLLPQTPTDGGCRRENGSGVWTKNL